MEGEREMSETIGMGMIVRNSEKTIEGCIKSFIDYVDQCVIVEAGESTDDTPKILRKLAMEYKKIELYQFEWIDDFAAARNFSFSKLTTDWYMWVDSDDIVANPHKLRELADKATPDVAAIWFPYYYALDEFGNLTTLFERERLLRAKLGWIWKGRLHETVSPITEGKFVRTDEVVIQHNHLASGPRNDRNFRILNIMLKESPEDKRIWLYLGHQHFAVREWLDAAKWYLKFGADKGAIDIERYQALNYCSKAMREFKDPQAVDVALMALELFPGYKDSYLELAHSYLALGDFDKALHWAEMSDAKATITEPPHIIFINPLDYTYNKFCLQAECYLKKGIFEKAFEFLQKAFEIRPQPSLQENINFVRDMVRRERAANSIKTLATHLLDGQEISKLPDLLKVVPYWMKDLPDYQMLKSGVGFYTKDMQSKPEIVEKEDGSVLINVGNVTDVGWLLKELDKTHDKVTAICPFPTSETKQIQVLSQTDFEEIVTAVPGRHLINLQREPSRMICEYDKKPPQGLCVRIFCGQGLENWNPQTIRDIGCGGSETWAAYTAKELAKRDCQPIIYGMDNQVWDGVIYRHFSLYNPTSIMSHLFISSRVPELFNTAILTKQRWLWFHDIHRWQRFTPEIASEIDALVVLSQWHVNFIKATYPFLKDAEVIDMDKNILTYDDCETQGSWYTDAKASHLPKLVILGNGIDTERFSELTEKRIPHRFIWLSSPDRGLEQVLDLWPLLKKALPDAELNIYYGWEYFDSALSDPHYRSFKEKIRKLVGQPGVEWRGRIGQAELARELMKADCLLYPPPHGFRETYGIAFLEAQAAGVLCFYRKNGALGETIGDRGIPLENNMTQEEIVDIIVSTLHNVDRCDKIRRSGREYAMGRSWGRQVEKLLEVYQSIELQQSQP